MNYVIRYNSTYDPTNHKFVKEVYRTATGDKVRVAPSMSVNRALHLGMMEAYQLAEEMVRTGKYYAQAVMVKL